MTAVEYFKPGRSEKICQVIYFIYQLRAPSIARKENRVNGIYVVNNYLNIYHVPEKMLIAVNRAYSALSTRNFPSPRQNSNMLATKSLKPAKLILCSV